MITPTKVEITGEDYLKIIKLEKLHEEEINNYKNTLDIITHNLELLAEGCNFKDIGYEYNPNTTIFNTKYKKIKTETFTHYDKPVITFKFI